ncbi:MAG: hypothetical protein EOP04_05135 [Proteobacteria bacterium]|nr:MAG: hypothetical protein EOP04_05135 [Pseudomonadota bacterium]
MLVTPRPLNLKFKVRGQEKTKLVLAWLLEWRVSSLQILSARIGLAPTSSTRFFKMLLSRNILERIKAHNSDKRDLVILGPEGHKMLGTSGIESAAELNRVRKYTKKKTLHHDLEAQKAVLKLMSQTMEVVSDFNSKMEGKTPDALLFRWNRTTQKVHKVAVEMEKTAKGSKAIYDFLNIYLDLIEKGEVSEVCVFFSYEDDLKTYCRYFDRDMWPSIGKKRIKNDLVPTTIMKTVAKDDWRRKKFIFKVLSPEEAPAIFPLESAAKLERFFVYPYLERLKDIEREPLIKKALEQEQRRKEEKEEEERLALQEELNERNEVEVRIGERRGKITALYAALDKAKREDEAPRAWLPGYKFQTQSALEALLTYLAEQLEVEEKHTCEAYEIA